MPTDSQNRDAVATAAGHSGGPSLPVAVAHGWAAAPPLVVRDSLSRYVDLMSKLTDVYAPSGSEQTWRSDSDCSRHRSMSRPRQARS